MSNWKIEDGIILFTTEENCNYAPTFSEIKKSIIEDKFVYCDKEYPSAAVLDLKTSILSINFKLCIDKADRITLYLSTSKKGIDYNIPIWKNCFVDYLVINNKIYPINGNVQGINDALTELSIPIAEMTYGQYMSLTKKLREVGVEYAIDNVKKAVEEIKSSEIEDAKALGLQANLYPYQVSGFNWLSFMMDNDCGCILGDEMGLGKTLQVIATIGRLKEQKDNSSFLVVCPVSLLENWKREIAKFYPSLNTHVNYGKEKHSLYIDLMPYDVVIVPYSCLQTDASMLCMIEWDVIAIDEAQNIKNPSAHRTKNLKSIPAKRRIAISGTPFENHMTDVWSIMDFITPGFLGSLNSFNAIYADDSDSAIRLEKLISPFIIRRLVKNVGNSLPPRLNIPQPIKMTEEEAAFYENGRLLEQEKFGLDERTIDKIQRLRVFCTHPIVYNEKEFEGLDPIKMSNKYARFCEILEEIFSRKEKVVVFTSFSKMINLIVNDVKTRFKVYTNYIDGSVPAENRQPIVDEFSSISGSAVLVLNPSAAGVGLNITAANHAIHYNLEWNPAKEDQASARVYRNGQTKNVFVHRLYYVDTIEEFINEKIQNKREISENVIVGNLGDTASREELIKVLGISPINSI